MDFKKLFRKDDKAVSPVIGVILMVAITVILAAAIGSSVFGQGTTKAAPKANLDIKSAGLNTSNALDIKIEHLGGDIVNLEGEVTKIMVSVNGGAAVQADPDTLKTLGVGDIAKLSLMKYDSTDVIQDNSGSTADNIALGDTVNIKLIDIQTNQIYLDKTIKV